MISLGLTGSVDRIFVCSYSGLPMEELTSVEAVAGAGLRGDRYVLETGYWSGVDECNVTLIEGEIVDRIAEDLGLPITSGQHRRNLVTRGIRLSQLLGRQFAVGEAILEYDRQRPPCQHLQAVSGPGTSRALLGQRGGIGARVLQSGFIRIGDPISVLSEWLTVNS